MSIREVSMGQAHSRAVVERTAAPQHEAAKVRRVPALGMASSGSDSNAPMVVVDVVECRTAVSQA